MLFLLSALSVLSHWVFDVLTAIRGVIPDYNANFRDPRNGSFILVLLLMALSTPIAWSVNKRYRKYISEGMGDGDWRSRARSGAVGLVLMVSIVLTRGRFASVVVLVGHLVLFWCLSRRAASAQGDWGGTRNSEGGKP